jgi:hypothetical protein
MIESNNGQVLSTKQDNRPRYTGEILLRTRPKTYRAIVRELAEPNASVNGISRRYRVSNHTVMGIREREAKSPSRGRCRRQRRRAFFRKAA